MQINKLIFIYLKPFSERDYDRFGIDILKKNGFEVEIVSLSRLFFTDEEASFDKINVVYVDSFAVFEHYVATNSHNTLYLKAYGESSKLLNINLILSKYNVQTLLINTNILPISINRQSFMYKLRYFFSTFSFKHISQRVYYFVNKHKIKSHDYVLVGGSEGLKCSGIGSRTKFIYAHTLDYDIFISHKKLPSLVEGKYAVFLDENLPYHPDEQFTGCEAFLKANASVYYQKLNRFFDRLESRYGLNIIIASHPSAHYASFNPFNNRTCIQGKTNQLVQHAEFCIGHFSTSIHFAILHYKPVLFVSLQEINYFFGDFIKEFAKKLNRDVVFIDQIDDVSDLSMSMDHNIYTSYVSRYIKDMAHSDREGNTWEIVAQYFLESNSKDNLPAT